MGERADRAIDELKQLDPETVDRAESLMAFSGFGGGRTGATSAAALTSTTDTSDTSDTSDTTDTAETADLPSETAAEEMPDLSESIPSPAEAPQAVAPQAENPQADIDEPPAEQEAATATGSQAEEEPQPPDFPQKAPRRMMIIGVPLAAGLVLMAIFAVLLRGPDFRSQD